MSHIYYNKPFHHLNNGIDLAEREIYSWCSGYGGPQGSASTDEALRYIDTTGIINETLIPYNNLNSYPYHKWEIIENISKESSLPSILKEQKFYSTPFKTQQGEEVGLSHLFYVKLLKKVIPKYNHKFNF